MSSSAHQFGREFQSRSQTVKETAGNRALHDSTINEGATSMRPAPSRERSNPYEPDTNDSTPPPRRYSLTKRLLHISGDGVDDSSRAHRSVSGRRAAKQDAFAPQEHGDMGKPVGEFPTKIGLVPRPIGGNEKLGMFSGVYVPTCLNVLSILMFLRFGFILGPYC